MSFDNHLLQEMNLLIRFPDSSMEGLKVHHTADSGLIGAAQRLHDKGLTTESDGGYLTDLGREAEDAAKLLLGLLSPH